MSETFLQPRTSFYFLENSFRMIQDLKQSHVKLVIHPVTGVASFCGRLHAHVEQVTGGFWCVHTHTHKPISQRFHSDCLRPVNMRVAEKVGQTFCGSINSGSSVGFLRVRAGCALSHVAVMNGHIVSLRRGHLLFFWLAATCEHFAPSAYLVHPQQLEQNPSKCFGPILQREGDLHLN